MEFAIGKTRAGLVPTLSMVVEVLELSDAFDALAIFEAFAVRELNRNGRTEGFGAAEERAIALHQRLQENGQLNQLMAVLGLKSYADRLRFGRRLLNAAYRD